MQNVMNVIDSVSAAAMPVQHRGSDIAVHFIQLRAWHASYRRFAGLAYTLAI